MTEDLTRRVDELSELVKRQSEVIAKTGKQMMEYQIKDVKSRMSSVDTKPQNIDTSDFATNDDLVELVQELQGQLDFLEDRNIKRVFNSHITEDSPEDSLLAPLVNRDGETAPEDFPKSLKELRALDKASLLRLCDFYDLIVEEETSPEVARILNADTLTKEDAQKLFNPQAKSLAERLESLTPADETALFDELARYIGVRIRRGEGW